MKTIKRELIIFITVTLASGWLGVLADSLITGQSEENSPGMLIWLVLPFISAVILRAVDHDREGFAAVRPMFRGSLKWYAMSFAYYPLVTLICIAMAKLSGNLDSSAFTSGGFMTLAVTSVLSGFIKNIFEEYSWRGFLTPKLIRTGISDWWVYVISGSVWGLWHSAYYLVFLPDSYFETISRAEMIVTGLVFMMIWSIMYTEIFRLTKSVWSCVIMHAMEDSVPTALVTVSAYIKFTGKSGFWLDPTTGMISAALSLAAGLFLRKIRIRKDPAERHEK